MENIVKTVRKVWNWIVEPCPFVQDTETRRNARLLMILLVSLIPLGLLVSGSPGIFFGTRPLLEDTDFLSTVASLLFWGMAYTLSKRGHYRVAVTMAIVAGAVVTFVASIADSDFSDISYALMPILLASLFFSLRELIFFIALNLATMLFVPLINPLATLETIITEPFSFVLIGSTLVVLANRHRDQLEQDRQASLAESEARYRGLFEAAFEVMAIHQNGIILDVNPGVETTFGYTPQEVIGRSVLDFLTPDSRFAVLRRPNAPGPFEVTARRKDGSTFPAEVVSRTQTYRGRNVEVVAVRDISIRKEAEAQIRASLQEKETLLREIHHRVKNNLQIISSLLSLQTDAITDPQIASAFRDSQSRIRAMALIHEKLYQSESLARIDFAPYLRHLTDYLGRVYDTLHRNITIRLLVEKVRLDIDTAVTCGLIINELVSNALKHAFPPEVTDQAPKIIEVLMKPAGEGEMLLQVRDNGVGLPAGFNLRQTESLGLQLVQTLARQLDGSITFTGEPQTTFQIRFPLLP